MAARVDSITTRRYREGPWQIARCLEVTEE